MNQLATATRKIRRLLLHAKTASTPHTSWPTKTRILIPVKPGNNWDNHDNFLLDLCTKSRRIQRYLDELSHENQELFLRYFVGEEPASRLAREKRKSLYRMYRNLQFLAETFLDALDRPASGPSRDLRNGRFTGKGNRTR